MGVREAILESRQVRSLAVLEVEDFGAFVFLELFGARRRGLTNLRAFAVLGLVTRVMQVADELAVGRLGNHAHRQHHQIGLDLDVVAEEAVGEVDVEPAVGLDTNHVASGHHHAGAFLNTDEEVFHVPRRTDVTVDDCVFDTRVDLIHFSHLPKGVHTALR